jgi:hypothetical protein
MGDATIGKVGAAMQTLSGAAIALVLFCASPVIAQDFHGYECTDDCSGHEAGYEWAEENGIEDPGDCGGNSQSFIEGCMAWAEENGSSGYDEEESGEEEE